MHDDASKIYVEKLETIVFHLDAFLDSPFLVNVAVNSSHSTKIDELTRIQAGRPGGDLEARGHRLLASGTKRALRVWKNINLLLSW